MLDVRGIQAECTIAGDEPNSATHDALVSDFRQSDPVMTIRTSGMMSLMESAWTSASCLKEYAS
jgi:hypothetical protein